MKRCDNSSATAVKNLPEPFMQFLLTADMQSKPQAKSRLNIFVPKLNQKNKQTAYLVNITQKHFLFY